MHRALEGPNPESFRKASGKPLESLRQDFGALDRGVAPNGGFGQFLTIHRFAHQSGRRERSGRVSTAKIHVFSARVFLDRSQKA